RRYCPSDHPLHPAIHARLPMRIASRHRRPCASGAHTTRRKADVAESLVAHVRPSGISRPTFEVVLEDAVRTSADELVDGCFEQPAAGALAVADTGAHAQVEHAVQFRETFVVP